MAEDSRHIWSQCEYERAVELIERGHDKRIVAHILGRTLSQLKEKLRYELMEVAKRTERVERAKQLRHQPAKTERIDHGVRSFEKAPVCVFEERKQRQAAQYRDLTAEFCGDPKIGFSALERDE